jgi:YegS/Rv2252/BmrU family lipid kinase
MRKVRVLINPKSGLPRLFNTMRQALDRFWDVDGVDLSYQFTQSKEDGIAKARRAVEEGVDTILVSGGDGTVSTIGRELVDTDIALGVIPGGSGNGFARHFAIPLSAAKAVEALASATERRIDVGMVNGTPFFVTCSMAWDAAFVRTFEKSPMRGILPYVFAGVQEFFDYERQNMRVTFNDGETIDLINPMIMTVANLTQFGGGAMIAPHAEDDDGKLEFVGALQKDFPLLLANIVRLFDGSVKRIPRLITRSTAKMVIDRQKAAPIQIDGELVDAPAKIEINVKPFALRVLVPQAGQA